MSFINEFMLVAEKVKKGETQYKNITQWAEAAGVPQSSLSKFLNPNNNSTITLENAAKLLDAVKIGLSVFSNTTRDICFIDAKMVDSVEGMSLPDKEDYFVVPLVAEVGAGAGVIPQEEILSWVMVYRWQEGIRNRSSNLVAVQIAKNANSMEPLLYPDDIVLIDRNEYNINVQGRIWLVKDPLDNSCMIKRVRTKIEDNDIRITYYSDNPEYEPFVYSLEKDFNNDWTNCIAGRVIWAWTDISNK